MVDFLTIVSEIVQTLAGLLVIYIYFKNRKKIESALKLYSHQKAFEDVGRLISNCLRAAEGPDFDAKKIHSELSEILGRLRGNRDLRERFNGIKEKLTNFVDDQKSVSGPRVRAVLGELQELIRTSEAESFENTKETK
jgi:hypothetical protein